MKLRLKYTEPQLDIFFPEVPAKYNIFPKGRRFGATHGAANACIEWCLEGMPVLWGDTINANISRYVDRYFLPTLKANNVEADWNDQKKLLKVGRGWIDFRSADRPENWEGFGYRKVLLNEAGIILADPYLYTNAVLPMMLDFADSELFALGVPKGKKLRNGEDHPFFKLYERVGTDGYRGRTYTSYDNPLIARHEVDELIAAMADDEQVRQEVFGEFIDRVSGNPFAFAFEVGKHIKPVERRHNDLVYISVDFNIDPFSAIAAHIYEDQHGHHFHTFNEVALKNASVQEMADWIATQSPGGNHLLRITGDRGGTSRNIGARGAFTLFGELQKMLGIPSSQLSLPPNPTHLLSRNQTNTVLRVHPDVRIDPRCTRLISDMQSVSVDQNGGILKSDRTRKEQQADALDCYRYLCNTFLRRWLDRVGRM